MRHGKSLVSSLLVVLAGCGSGGTGGSVNLPDPSGVVANRGDCGEEGHHQGCSADAGTLAPDAGTSTPDAGTVVDGGLPEGPQSVYTQFFGEDDALTRSMNAAVGINGTFVATEVWSTDGGWAQLGEDRVKTAPYDFYMYGFNAYGLDGGTPSLVGRVTEDPWGRIDVAGTCGENANCANQAHGPGVVGAFLFQVYADDANCSQPIALGGSIGTVTVVAIDHDSLGELYLAGSFSGAQVLGGTSLDAEGSHAYLARYADNLVPRWGADLTSAGGLTSVSSLSVGPDGTVLVGGAASADSDAISGTVPAVALYSPDSTLLWMDRLDPAGGPVVGVAWAGDEWIAARATGPACDPAASPCVSSGEGQVLAGAKDGSRTWTVAVGAQLTSIAGSASEVLLAGNARSTFAVGDRLVPLASGIPSIFVVALNPDGTPRWKHTVTAEGAGPLQLTSIALSPTGQSMITGYTGSPVTFEWHMELTGTTLAAFFSVLAAPTN